MSLMYRPKVCTNLLTSAKLQFSTSSGSLKSHYDALGVSSSATQSDIKTAYYKLTKIYHPDKNKSEEAKAKFRNITDAYEILGNYKSRKMYDRGMRPGPRHMDHREPEERREEDAQTRFYKSRLRRTQVTARDGRVPIYNFDEWARAHYGNLFDQNIRAREAVERNERRREREHLELQNDKFWIPIVLVFFTLAAVVFTSSIDHDYDRNKIASNAKEPR